MTSITDDREPSLATQLPSSTEIMEGRLYLGNLASSLDLEYRRKLGITHVVCACPEGLQALTSSTDHRPNDDVKVGIKDENDKFLYIPVEDDEYEDILTHLPRACAFIESSLLSPKGRVLVHCKMGVSRSVTTVAAYLMKSRQMKSFDAVEYIRAKRPHIHPNYGFLKQLEIFEQSKYTAPAPRDPVYRSWKRKYAQDVQSYLGYAGDVVSIGTRDGETAQSGGSGDSREGSALYLASDLPEDLQKGRHLLREFEVTHLVVIGGDSAECETKAAAKELGLHVHEITDLRCSCNGWGEVDLERENEWLETSVFDACRWMLQAIGRERESNNGQGSILVYSPNEARACVVICAYLMASRGGTSIEALSILQKSLPFFTPPQTFLRQLKALDSLNADLLHRNNPTGFTKPLSPPITALAAKISATASGLAQMEGRAHSLIPLGSTYPTVPLVENLSTIQPAKLLVSA